MAISKGCETVATRTQGGWRRVIQAETVKVAEPDHRGPGGWVRILPYSKGKWEQIFKHFYRVVT